MHSSDDHSDHTSPPFTFTCRKSQSLLKQQKCLATTLGELSQPGGASL